MSDTNSGTSLNCEEIRKAITELRNLMEEFNEHDPEDVRARIMAFLSALNASGLVRKAEKDKKRGKTLLSDALRGLKLNNFGANMAEVELFELYTSPYSDPDEDTMAIGRTLLEGFGPKLAAELERMEAECSKNTPTPVSQLTLPTQ